MEISDIKHTNTYRQPRSYSIEVWQRRSANDDAGRHKNKHAPVRTSAGLSGERVRQTDRKTDGGEAGGSVRECCAKTEPHSNREKRVEPGGEQTTH